MRFCVLIILIVLSISCKNENASDPKLGSFDYLIGDWERTNSKDSGVTREHWKKESSTIYKGHSYTHLEKYTTFQEYLSLKNTDNTWILEVAGPNENPVQFKVTSLDTNGFVAENPEHDFPKTISYLFSSDTLRAKVSNDEFEVPFDFIKIQH